MHAQLKSYPCRSSWTRSALILHHLHRGPPWLSPLQAVLINSANTMGGSSEPNGRRGFGRVHLEPGLPLAGVGNIGLFVADSNTTSIAPDSVDSYTFETRENNAGEFRATLTWIDPPASTISSVQLVHDLDLVVTSPVETAYTMWSSGESDSNNVIERVVVSSADFEGEGSGTWTVSVSASTLISETQPYSLVVTGPFGNGTAVATSSTSTVMRPQGIIGGKLLVWAVAFATVFAGMLPM